MSTETLQNVPNSTSPQKHISISFDDHGSLTYNFSSTLTLAEIIGSFVIIGSGLLAKTMPNEILHAVYEKVSQLPVLPPQYGHLHTSDGMPVTDDLISEFANPLQRQWEEFQKRNS